MQTINKQNFEATKTAKRLNWEEEQEQRATKKAEKNARKHRKAARDLWLSEED